MTSAEDYSAETVAEYGYAYNTLRRLQESVESFFTQAGVPLPERRFIAVGDLGSQSWDCEQLSFNFIKMYFGSPGQGEGTATGCPLALSGDFVIQLVRCVPTARTAARGNTKVLPPKVEDVEDVALVQAIDSQLLLEAVLATPSMQFVKAVAAPTGVQGIHQAINIELSISLAP